MVWSIQWGEAALKIANCKSVCVTEDWQHGRSSKTMFKWPEFKDSSALWFGGRTKSYLRFWPSVSTLRKRKCTETDKQSQTRSGRPIDCPRGKYQGSWQWSKTTQRPPSKTFKVILRQMGSLCFIKQVHLVRGKAVRVSVAKEAFSVFAVGPVLALGSEWKSRVAWITLNISKFLRIIINLSQSLTRAG